MAVRRNTIIYLARRDFSALVLFPLSLSLSLLTSLVHVYNSILIGNPRGPSNTIEKYQYLLRRIQSTSWIGRLQMDHAPIFWFVVVHPTVSFKKKKTQKCPSNDGPF
jgi:hypothetical protein